MERRKNRISWIPVLLVVVLLCSLAYMLASRIVQSRSSTLRTAILLPARSTYQVKTLGNGVLYYDGATLHALNGKGRQTWSYSVGTGAGFSVGSGGVATWSGTLISLLSDTGETLYSGRVEDEILSAYLGETYAAVQVGEEHNSTMLLIGTDGRQIDRIELNNQTVLDFGFFNNGALFWVMSLDTEGTVPTCSVSTYRPGKTISGTITDSQQVLYEVLFQSSQVRVVGNTHIKDYDYTGKEITADRILVYGWYLMGLDENGENPLMVFAPMDEAGSSSGVQDIRLVRGQTDQSIRLPFAASKLLACGDAAYAFTSEYVMVCRIGSSTPERYKLPMYVDSVIGLTQDHRAIVTYNGSVYLVPLP